jgi:hypothetical protein
VVGIVTVCVVLPVNICTGVDELVKVVVPAAVAVVEKPGAPAPAVPQAASPRRNVVPEGVPDALIWFTSTSVLATGHHF